MTGNTPFPSFPRVPTDHLRRLTDDTGLIQHAVFGVPDRRHGYCLDDNARALIVSLWNWRLTGDPRSLELANAYLSFVLYCLDPAGGFHNFLGYDRTFTDPVGSEDSLGRALWALGFAQDPSIPWGIRLAAREYFMRHCAKGAGTSHPRSMAFAAIGFCHFLEATPTRALIRTLKDLARGLRDAFEKSRKPGWPWFEERLTYCNAAVPKAMILAGEKTGDRKCSAAGFQALDFLIEKTFAEGYFSPPGNRGWWPRDGAGAVFDQQPVEAGELAEAAAISFKLTGAEHYREASRRALGWFFGENVHRLSLFDSETGGCCDGLTPRGANLNQGAESILSLLLGDLAYQDLVLGAGETRAASV
ncbi:MAG: glycosyltransferase [Firmicutes bacterium]|nr:glycosyltransferase [Bacillota bacterium]